MNDVKTFKTQVKGIDLSVEIGKLATLATGSCLVRYGDTVVMCCATMSERPRDGIDFFPLSVDFEEKLYAVGRIPGSFMRREGRPSERAILASRLIDRPLRPLFPSDLRNDVAVVCTVMSVDPEASAEFAAFIGASVAISISGIPFNGPVSAMNVGQIDGNFVLNPSCEEQNQSDLFVTVASTDKLVAMIEAAANEVDEKTMLEAIMFAHDENVKLVSFINDIKTTVNPTPIVFESKDVDPEMFEAIKTFAIDKVKLALDTDDKRVRDERLVPIKEEIHEKFDEVYAEREREIDECIYKLQKYVVRRWLLDDGKRVDGRGIDEVRPLASEVGLLPRVHGSGLFTRGQTQVLSTVTLGQVRDSQLLDNIYPEDTKRYMHHYNFPSYSVGETRPNRGPGRREIGHGALAEKALLPVIPSLEDFPYSLRVVSEILSSNGSTSQGAICGCTLALMDAGVPIKAPVAGISCGLVTEGDRWMTMVDIQGLEDFFGDMDFKVAGTPDGITAIQMDLKIDGLTREIIEEALEKTRVARLMILEDVMLKAINSPREELSPYAPKMLTTKIHPDKIREIIGSGGKVIQKICADYNCKVDVEDDGSVFVSAINIDDANAALQVINTIANDPEPGTIFTGTVTRLMNFGAFVEIAPGKEGLVHISQLDNKRTEKVEDVCNVGDTITVMVQEIDDMGRLNLSRKAALQKENA